MIAAPHSDLKWLQFLLHQAIEENWCTHINCTTCGSNRMHLTIDPCLQTAAEAKLVIDALRECTPPPANHHPFEEAVRWVLYEVWARFGGRFDSDLKGTYAGEVLKGMQEHHARQINARRIHDQRQSVKQRDWKE